MVKTDNNKNHSYEISPTVEISASAGEVWSFLIDVENWWVKSNPEHKWLVIHNAEKDISIGTKITVREKIAGIPCKAIGEITGYKPYQLVEWRATYFLLGIKWIKVFAGVSWKLKSIDVYKSSVAANVWADFPQNFGYRLLWFLFTNIINGIKKDYEHSMRELVYIKETIECNTKYQSKKHLNYNHNGKNSNKS